MAGPEPEGVATPNPQEVRLAAREFPDLTLSLQTPHLKIRPVEGVDDDPTAPAPTGGTGASGRNHVWADSVRRLTSRREPAGSVTSCGPLTCRHGLGEGGEQIPDAVIAV